MGFTIHYNLCWKKDQYTHINQTVRKKRKSGSNLRYSWEWVGSSARAPCHESEPQSHQPPAGFQYCSHLPRHLCGDGGGLFRWPAGPQSQESRVHPALVLYRDQNREHMQSGLTWTCKDENSVGVTSQSVCNHLISVTFQQVGHITLYHFILLSWFRLETLSTSYIINTMKLA